jgi:hypothetical protein
MNEHQIKNNGTTASRFTSTGRGIPVQFIAEPSRCVPIKIQSPYAAGKSSGISEKSIMPALFQLAARVDDSRLAPAFRNVLTLNREIHPEKMLDREKLEGILKAIAKRKKTVRR